MWISGFGNFGAETEKKNLGLDPQSSLFPKKPQVPLGPTETLLCLPPPHTTSVRGLFCSEASALVSVSLAEGAEGGQACESFLSVAVTDRWPQALHHQPL